MKSEDIARLAGVSRSTVSRVINNYSNVPEETRLKVMKIIEQYNYEPNTSARVLAGKGTNTLGLFVVSIAEKNTPNRIYQNNYFAPFVDAVVDVANAKGYYVLVHILYSQKDYLKLRQAYLQKRIDGGIVIGTEKDARDIMDVSHMGYPMAIVDYEVEDIVLNKMNDTNLMVVNSADYEGTVEALNYLVDCGHRDIGIIAGRMSTYSGRQRYRAFEQVMKQNGLKINKDFIIRGDFLKKKTQEEITRLVQSRNLPTALFSCNDDMAMVAMEVFKREGIRVPEDISIIGFDDVPVASQITPALTTVRVPVFDMVRKTVEGLIHIVDRGGDSFSTYCFPTQLMVRETVRKRE
jgi:LacI family transcriptional regulator